MYLQNHSQIFKILISKLISFPHCGKQEESHQSTSLEIDRINTISDP